MGNTSSTKHSRRQLTSIFSMLFVIWRRERPETSALYSYPCRWVVQFIGHTFLMHSTVLQYLCYFDSRKINLYVFNIYQGLGGEQLLITEPSPRGKYTREAHTFIFCRSSLFKNSRFSTLTSLSLKRELKVHTKLRRVHNRSNGERFLSCALRGLAYHWLILFDQLFSYSIAWCTCKCRVFP